MTQQQVNEAYQAYREAYLEAMSECEKTDKAQAEAYAKLKTAERRCEWAWQHYKHCLEALGEGSKNV